MSTAVWTRIHKECNITFTEKWKKEAEEHLRKHRSGNVTLMTPDQIFQFFYQLILNVDMRGKDVLKKVSFPSKISEIEKCTLKGRWMLQIESVTNCGVGMEQRVEDHKNAGKKMVTDLGDENDEMSSSDEYDEIEDRGKREYSKRMLKLCLSDGKQIIWGIEYKDVPDLSIASVGQKVFVSNVLVRHGLLLLTRENTKVLGGTFFVPKRMVSASLSSAAATGTSSKYDDIDFSDDDDLFMELDDV